MYRVSSYFLGRMISEIPGIIFYPILFTSISYFIVGLNPAADRFFMFLFLIICTTFCMQSLGFLIASFSSNQQVAMAIAPLLLTCLMLFGGFYLV
jgi:ABC-type multidrug transport system permease subunit